MNLFNTLNQSPRCAAALAVDMGFGAGFEQVGVMAAGARPGKPMDRGRVCR